MVDQMRPPTEDSGGTCDWGGCDELSTAERLDPRTAQWLPVCAAHEAPRPAPPTFRRGCCVECGKETALSTAGKVRAHDVPGTFSRCRGGGHEPGVRTSTDGTT
jgi:hypothetical protein